MPSYSRSHSPPVQGLVTGFADLKMVGFTPSPVTAVSRQPTSSEATALRTFEDHASRCRMCYDPYRAHRDGRTLCDVGHQEAKNVARLIYSEAAVIYSKKQSSSTNGAVRVEVPKTHSQVHSLMRAMERSLRHRRQDSIISHDRTYNVSSRPVERSSSQRSQRQTSPPRRRQSSRHSHSSEGRRYPVIVDWPEESPASSRPEQAQPSSFSTASVSRSARTSDEHLPSRRTKAERPQSMYASPSATINLTDRSSRRSSVVLPEAPMPPRSYAKEPPSSAATAKAASADSSASSSVAVLGGAEAVPYYATALRQPRPHKNRQSTFWN